MIVSRKGSELSMQRSRTISFIVLALVIIFLVIYIALLADDRWKAITEVLSMFVGLFSGTFLLLGLFRRFGWGESAARSIIWSVLVGGMTLILLSVVVLDDALDAPQPNLATIVYWTAFGFVLGAVARTARIRNQLRAGERP
jgi:O-antigen/teichoic acid export membrane protein